MNDRASNKPLMLNTDNLDSSEESSDDESVTMDTLSDPENNTLSPNTTSTERSKLFSAATKTTLTIATPENDTTIGHKRTSSSRPRSIGSIRKKVKDTVDELTANYSFVDLKKKQLAQEKDFQLQSLNLKREKVAQANREIDARVVEATARTLHFRAQAESCEMECKIKLLRERLKLLQDGVPQREIDMLLPLSSSDLQKIVE
ncbi:hypothetical protein GN244_ATG13933 [Phytophthora infestans]|uniref:Uncharacterized protein n=1 Tax=Phytophthora infestans TaxID=4787 RepID=A0A833SWV7_PHYIN|nr:hypothetical protein GN244_ATG13933 [Phytophthora infestans]